VARTPLRGCRRRSRAGTGGRPRLPEPSAALATTNATVALSLLSFACVRLTQNRLAIVSSPFAESGRLDAGATRGHDRSAGTTRECRPAPPGHARSARRPVPAGVRPRVSSVRAAARRTPYRLHSTPRPPPYAPPFSRSVPSRPVPFPPFAAGSRATEPES